MTASGAGRLRVAAVADADSFVKWAAALVDGLPDVEPRLAIVRTPLAVSAAQQRTALDGTRLQNGPASRIRFDEVEGWLDRTRPDVLVLAGRGPFVRLVMREVDRLRQRPVVVMGLPGMSIPAQRGAVQYRRQADLMLVHSRREMRAFTELAARLEAPIEFGLATLPFARTGQRPVRGGTDLVFAAQAIVPREREERAQLAGILREAALAHPDRRVVVKLRSRREAGEEETHFERAAYTELLTDPPPNLVFAHTSMREALETAEGLVTVSSTAAIEAMALGLPVIALDTFGVRKTHLNTVFVGSGVLGGGADVVARRFRHPSASWREQNYFHDEADSTWWERTQELVALRRQGELAPRTVPPARGGALHLAWHRKSVLGAEDRTLSGRVALAVGTPLTKAVLAARRLRGRRGAATWFDDASDFTVTPARHQDPIRRSRLA